MFSDREDQLESTQARSTCYRLFHSEYIYQVQSTLPLMNDLIVRQISTSFPINLPAYQTNNSGKIRSSLVTYNECCQSTFQQDA